MYKNILSMAMLLLVGGGLLAGCSKEYDDTEIWDKVNDLDRRVSNLEEALSDLNRDIVSLQQLLETKQGGKSIVNVTQTAEGYTVTFSDGQTITLRNGRDGAVPEIINGYWWIGSVNTGIKAQGNDGATPEIHDGYWWIAGVNTYVPASGGSGSAINVPIIGVAEYNGVYYWTQTINGTTTWLTDQNGNKFPVSGEGSIRPLIQVNVNGYWVISYDGGNTWIEILNANGQPVSAGKGGGGSCDCTTFFLDVFYVDGILTIVLADGQTIQIPCEANADIRFDLVLPKEMREQLSTFMPIYTGATPPHVEGTYRFEETTTVFCSDLGNGGFAPGVVRNPMVIRFKNQDSRLNIVDYDQYEENVGLSVGQGVYISGSGDHFTAYFNVVGAANGINSRRALVISGTKTAAGIRDCYYAVAMIEKDSDPKGLEMSVGAYRVFKDGDGMSQNSTWPSLARQESAWAGSWMTMNEQ